MASHNHKLLLSAVALMAMVNVDAQPETQRLPRLVVNILVDQLRTDYMEAFSPLYGENGFKRFINEGRYYTDVQYPFKDVDRASATACFITGATPYDNGIPAQTWLSRKTLRPFFCIDDAEYTGQHTFEKSAPTHLLTTSLTDEMELATSRDAHIYAFAPEREMAVLLAGHIADGAFWIDNTTGQWSSTSFYGNFPTWAEQFLKDHDLNVTLKNTVWEPTQSNDAQEFNYFLCPDTATLDFSHEFLGESRFSAFKRSALINEEVALMVDVCLTHTMLGADRVPDILNIGLYAGNYLGKAANAYPAELQDTYVRLDQALAHLFASIDQIVGRQQVLYVLASTGYTTALDQENDLSVYKIPTGTFDMHRAAMLLNMYLSAIYGQAQYVIASHQCQLYLDHQLIEQRQLQLTDVLQRSGDFLSQMAGVRNVYTSKTLIAGAGNPLLQRIRNGWNVNCSGDVVVEVHPGWKILGEDGAELRNSSGNYTNYPLIFLGADIKSQRIEDAISVAAVAPTLSRHLRIRAPNGSMLAPLF